MRQLRSYLISFKALVGPWPIEPFYLGFLTFFMVASLYSLDNSATHTHTFKEVLLRPIFSTVIAFLTMGQLKIVTKIFQKSSGVFGFYFLILAFQAFSVWSWIVLFRSLFPTIHASFTAFLSPLPVVRFLFTYLSVNAFIGLSRARLSKALAEKEEALHLVESQRNLLLEYDENTRAKLSEFLHDRVQSALVTTCLELQEISHHLSDKDSKEITRIINSLENLRSVDVRNASQTLSPAVGNADLYTSISLMAESYAPQIKVRIDINPEIDSSQVKADRELFLGVYRIIEQAFLNSHIHGNAKHFNISISTLNSYLVLKVVNDGSPLPTSPRKGLGTAIINSWVRTLDGRWELRNLQDGSVELEAVLPR